MSDTLDWLCGELGVAREIITSARRDNPTTSKRRIIVLFFKINGKSSVWMERCLNRDHSSILHAVKCASDAEKKRACELVKKYTTQIEGGSINELKVDNIRRKIKIRVPNYHTGTIDEKEVFADEYKPKFTELQYDYKPGVWNK